MHVLYIHQYFSTLKGSFITRSYEMAKQLIARGHTVTMLCGSYTGTNTGIDGPVVQGIRRGEVEGINVIQFDMPLSNADSFGTRKKAFVEFALKCVPLVMREEYDLLFATSTPLTVAIPGIMGKLLRRKPFVFEIRDLWPEVPRALGAITNPMVFNGLVMLEKAAYRCADHCIGLSPGMVEGIAAKGKPSDAVTMVPNGCDLDIFQPTAQKGIGLPGIEPGDFVAVFSGAHGLANGLGAVVDAAAVLQARQVTNIKLVLIGQGMEKPKLVQRARELGLTNCLFVDPVPKEQLATMLPRADLGLMILANVPEFHYGSSPNKFFDYLSCGLPVLVNHPGWVSSLVREHQCGVSVEPGNPESFADALLDLRDHPEKRRQMGMHARQLAEQQFNRTDLANSLIDTLEQVCARYRR